VESGEWYSNAVIWAKSNGVVEGIGGGLFGTNDNITREQLVTILYRYSQTKNISVSKTTDLTAYTDADNVSEYASDAMKWAVANGIIEGVTLTTISPRGAATRAQVATILQRFIENI
ncbi:MAG: S-layer homology domain-containing protein, partial [Oscillospiraceae bacterium]|nr:S-layer homology domain-containing protein [Oscillospiraceae bacterium]